MIINKIEQALKVGLTIDKLAVSDDSDKHAKHPEAKRYGGGHYYVLVVTDDFENQSLIQRHRMIYKLLDPFKDEIHALGIQAYTKAEYAQYQDRSL